MEEPHDRLQQARRRARFQTASDAARAFGWNENSYRSHENGERGLKRDVAERYSKAFKVSLTWLMFGLGELQNSFEIRISGELYQGQRFREFTKSDPVIIADLKIFFDVSWFCFRVADHSFHPKYNMGDLVICSDCDHMIENKEIEGVVILEDSSCIFGKIYGDFERQFSIEVHNSPTIRNVIPSEIRAVETIVRAGRYLLVDDATSPDAGRA